MNPSPKPKLWPRVLVGLGVGLVVGMVALVIGGHWWLEHFLHSDAFRKLISQKTSAALHAEGEFLPLHWSGTTAHSDGYHARGLPGTPLQELRAEQVRAELSVSGLFHNEWRVSGLEVERLYATISPPAIPANPLDAVSALATAARASSAPASASSQSSRKLILEPMRIRDANIEWTTGGSSSGAVRHAQLTLASGDASWEVSSPSGELVIGGMPPLRIEQAQVRFQRDAVFITDSLFRLAEGGKVNVNGQVAFSAARGSDLALRFEDVPLDRWLPKDWRGRLVGRARGVSFVRGQLGDSRNLSATGTVELADAKLEALPVLNRLAAFTGSEQFRQMQLQKARTDFAWTPTQLVVRRLVMESSGLLRVEGGCVVEKNVMEGEFDVGVSAGTLRWLPGARGRVFTTERDGYLWTKVKVQGPVDDIREDLSTRLVAAAGTELIEGTKGAVQKGAATILDMFHKMTQ